MRISLTIANFMLPGGASELGARLGRAAARLEAAGLSSIWVMDHFFQIPPLGPAESDMLEGYSVLSFLAAHTRRVRLGTMVTGVTYRHPGVLVKTVTSLDVLSGGRAWFGIGAAWFEREHKGLGVPFPPLGERFERLEETLQIALQMWSPNNGPYHGRHYQLQETLCMPQPLSKPRPPIMIGGSGEKKTLRMVAQYAEACNIFGDAATVRAKLAVLRAHCERLGRDYEAIEKTVMVLHREDPEVLLAELAALAAAGADDAILAGMDLSKERNFDLLAEVVVPRAAQLRVR
jgi:F420-dependent oxidoreductase-like protein